MKAQLCASDLKNGGKPTKSAKRQTKENTAPCGYDDNGHLICYEWNGQGNEDNIFPQNSNVSF